MKDKNNLQEDLDDILITGAVKSEVKEYLFSKGYDQIVVESELAKIPFVVIKSKEAKLDSNNSVSTPMKRIAVISHLITIIGLSMLLFSKILALAAISLVLFLLAFTLLLVVKNENNRKALVLIGALEIVLFFGVAYVAIDELLGSYGYGEIHAVVIALLVLLYSSSISMVSYALSFNAQKNIILAVGILLIFFGMCFSITPSVY